MAGNSPVIAACPPAVNRVPAAEPRGFTLLEVAITVAILGVLVALSWSGYSKTRPRAKLAATATDIHALIHGARQQALATGHDVSVLFYPAQATGSGTGRVVEYLDMAGGFMTNTAPPGYPSFCTYDPGAAGAQAPNDVLDTVEIPRQVAIAPPANPVALTFPYNVPQPTTGCSFCGASPNMGAIRFDSRGRATFFSTCGVPGAFPNGGSISLTSAELAGSRVLAVTPGGSVRIFDAE